MPDPEGRARPTTTGRLHQVDIVRLLTFFAVIAVHAVAFTEQPSNRTAAAALMLLQVGREVFFALTGFVLVHSARGHPVRALPFWRRRLTYVAIPYAAWTLIYTAYAVRTTPGAAWSWRMLLRHLAQGNAEYHLYFLVVTMQLYLVFPLLLRFVRRTAAHAALVLGLVGVANLGWLALLQYGHAPAGWGGLWVWAYELLPTYLVFVLVGCYAALHLERLQAFVARRGRRLLAIALVAAGLAEVAYFLQLPGRDPRTAASALQPATFLSSAAAILALYVAGCRWAAGRRRGRAAIARMSDISFGVYLAHPLVLSVLLGAGLGNDHQVVPAAMATLLAIAGTTAGAVVLSLLARRTVLSLPLTGRQRTSPGGSHVRHSPSPPLPRSMGTVIEARPRVLARPSTVRSQLSERAAGPDRAAFVVGATGKSTRWPDIALAAQAWDARRSRLRAEEGAVVGLLVADPLGMATNFLGALAAGVCIAPLDPGAPEAEVLARARDIGLRAVVTDGGSSIAPERLAAAGLDVWSAGGGALDLLMPASAADWGERWRRPPAAMVMASSGTTGAPKIIALSEASLIHAAAAIVDHHRLSADDVGYCPLPLFHINALVVGLLSTLVGGGRLVIDRRFSSASFWATVGEQGATWLNLAPGIVTLLAAGPTPPPEVRARVRFARSASAPLAPATLQRFERRCGIGVLETYGMTEAASQITANPLRVSERRPGSVGRPVGVELRVVDGDGRPVPAGTVGRIEVRGASVVARYWAPAGAEPSTRPATGPSGWLGSGDLGHADRAGFVYLVGRSDDVINRGGEKVYPREVEEVLLAHPEVTAAAVVGRPRDVVGEEPVAIVVTTGRTDPDRLVRDLAELCAHRLARFKRPAAILVDTHLPTGPTGKVRRTELRQRLADRALTP